MLAFPMGRTGASTVASRSQVCFSVSNRRMNPRARASVSKATLWVASNRVVPASAKLTQLPSRHSNLTLRLELSRPSNDQRIAERGMLKLPLVAFRPILCWSRSQSPVKRWYA